MDFSTIEQSVPKSLPVLDSWIEAHGDQTTFKGVTVLQIQHQLGNHFPQARALLDLGLDRSKLIWIDIPYTSIPEVRRALIEELEIPRKISTFTISVFLIATLPSRSNAFRKFSHTCCRTRRIAWSYLMTARIFLRPPPALPNNCRRWRS